jgi:hypothetical protein
MTTKLAKIILTIGFAFCLINACIFPLIWTVAQIKPGIDIASLYQLKNNLTTWLICCIALLFLAGLVLGQLLKQSIDTDHGQDFLNRDLNQNGKWLFLLPFILIISELIQCLLGHPPGPVDFVQGNWVVYWNKSSFGTSVTENIAYNIMWNQCRLLSGVLAVVNSFAAFAMRSYGKILNLF